MRQQSQLTNQSVAAIVVKTADQVGGVARSSNGNFQTPASERIGRFHQLDALDASSSFFSSKPVTVTLTVLVESGIHPIRFCCQIISQPRAVGAKYTSAGYRELLTACSFSK